MDRIVELEAKIAALEKRLAELESKRKEPSAVEVLVELGRMLARERKPKEEGFVPPAWKEAEKDPARPIRGGYAWWAE